MKNMISCLYVISVFFLIGCTNTIFHENFDSYTGRVQMYPAGDPPADIIKIVPGGGESPTVTYNNKLFFTDPISQAWLISNGFNNPESTKTIYWEGDIGNGEGPMWFVISAGDTSGDFGYSPSLRMKIWDDQVILEEYISNSTGFNHLKGPASISGVHYIFISLKIGSGTYYITMSSSSASEKKWTGSLHPQFVNHLKSNSRIIMHVAYPLEAKPSQYNMDNIVMREKE